ncbi:MAG TPA: metallophosphoesterase [Acidimicrobiia bacterium]|nr:metallophosphoesterase [Acidimicrobiia bacterium]
MKRIGVMLAVLVLGALGLSTVGDVSMTGKVRPLARAAAAGDPVIAVAGDIACSPSDPAFNNARGSGNRCRMMATSDLLVNRGLAAVLVLGDNQYNGGSFSDYMASYDPTWGRVKSITRSVAGNHEYGSAGAGGYFKYFGLAAGPAGKGWYSFDIGSWHLIALNSNCTDVQGCGTGSPQEQWLRADLAANRSPCTLAFFHHGRYSSGHDGDSTFMAPLFQDLYAAGADVALSGHSHDYERFAQQDNAGNLDTARGIRQFIVGTGGAFFTGWPSGRDRNSQVSENTSYGVLDLTLHPGSYDWRFAPIAGSTFTDTGTTACHRAQADTVTPPPAPSGPGAAPYWPGLDVARGVALRHNGAGGYVLDLDGYLHPYGGAPALLPSHAARGSGFASNLSLVGTDAGGAVVDRAAGVYGFGAPPPVRTCDETDARFGIPTRGIAVDPNWTSGTLRGATLDAWGGLHLFCTSPPITSTGAPYWPGWDIARGIALTPGGRGGLLLDGWGGVHAFGNAHVTSTTAYWPGWDIARGIAIDGNGHGVVVDGWGGLHSFTYSTG